MHILGCEAKTALGLAISGGGDSLAMLHLTLEWRKSNDIKLYIITINHQLRPEATAEARWLQKHCHALNLPCDIRVWTDAPSAGNLQQQARQARRVLIADWAQDLGIDTVLLGHTMDDQAETFLMRLARGSGVYGLSAIAPSSHACDINWQRPLLNMRRAALRDYLHRKNVQWLEDPSNNDPRFDRVKMRQAQPMLDELGLSVERLAFTATQLRRARIALNTQLSDQLDKLVRNTALGALELDTIEFAKLPDELRLRLLGHIMRYINEADFTPRLDALQRLLDAIAQNKPHTLAGVMGQVWQGYYRFYPELAAIDVSKYDSQRWHIQHPKGTYIRPLADSLNHIADWRDYNAPRAELKALPAVFRDDMLLASPLHTELSKNITFKLRANAKHFVKMLATH